jgi:hypothetical protein
MVRSSLFSVLGGRAAEDSSAFFEAETLLSMDLASSTSTGDIQRR